MSNTFRENWIWAWTVSCTASASEENRHIRALLSDNGNFPRAWWKHALLKWERIQSKGHCADADHIQNLLLITQLLITEQYCSVLWLRAAAELLFLNKLLVAAKFSVFLFSDPHLAPWLNVAINKTDLIMMTGPATDNQAACYKAWCLWGRKITNCYHIQSTYVSSVVPQRRASCIHGLVLKMVSSLA